MRKIIVMVALAMFLASPVMAGTSVPNPFPNGAKQDSVVWWNSTGSPDTTDVSTPADTVSDNDDNGGCDKGKGKGKGKGHGKGKGKGHGKGKGKGHGKGRR